MKIRHGCGRQHNVLLVDDGTLDTVLEVDGRMVRYNGEFAASYRDKEGRMTRRGLRALAIEACNDDSQCI